MKIDHQFLKILEDGFGIVLSSLENIHLCDKDKEQEKLEMEMTKRRERIEQWRAEKKKREIDALKADIKGESVKKAIQGRNSLMNCD